MGTINRAAINKLLWVGINTVFGLNYAKKATEWPKIFEKRSSHQAWEEDQLMSGTGYAAVKPEGAPVMYDEMRQGWTARYDHDTIALALRVTEEARDDNLYFKIGAKGGRSLANSMHQTCEVRGANVLNNATSVNHLGGDGVPLLSVAHPLMGGGVYGNTLAIPAEISETALEDLLILADTAVDDRGLPIKLEPKRLLISRHQRFNVHRLLRTVNRVGTGDNDTNALRALGVFPEDPVMVTHLSNPRFWGFTTDAPDGGLVAYVRKETVTDNEVDFDTRDFKFLVLRRDSFGWTDPRGFYGCDPV